MPSQTDPGWAPCPGRGTPPAPRFDPLKFRDLPVAQHRLVEKWSRLAVDKLRGPERLYEASFEAFIYAWFAFNGWASCCCGEARDEDLIRWMAADRRLQAAFDDLRMPGGPIADQVQAFSSLWPIFQASQVRDSHHFAMDRYAARGRGALVELYREEHPNAKRAPDCHYTHPEGTDPDWLHTLRALYRVRNNLFHGTKSAFEPADQEVVVAAAAVLAPTVNHLIDLDYR